MTRRRLIPLAALAVPIALAACGSSPSTGSASSTTAVASTTSGSGGAGANAQFGAYRDCLAQHGVTLPQRAPNGSAPAGTTGGDVPDTAPAGGRRGNFGLDTTDPTVQAAMQACAALRPQFNGQGGGQRGQQFQAYLSCLEDNGVAPPSTTVASSPVTTTTPTGAGGPGGGRGGGLQGLLAQVRNDPNFAKANAKCGVLLPQPGGAAGATTTTAG